MASSNPPVSTSNSMPSSSSISSSTGTSKSASSSGPKVPVLRSVTRKDSLYHMGRQVVAIPKYPFRQAVGAPPGAWTTGLYGCLESPDIACCTLLCLCVQAGRNIELISDGTTDAITASWYSCLALPLCGLYGRSFRTRLRLKYQLPQEPCGDWPTHFFCHCCAVCQEARELDSRGWNPRLGFAGNIKEFARLGMAPPPLSMIK
eukprot:TRINITY_DN32352_c0_g1_i1.p1 TRINITY_DN32352_c0_g1~~TRINITY_DN32352_c0_g1_i1.p1  ORF type:complete len:204 (+),score=13.16 TRINITY_DN32352_c0_g1_i1:415-1026(+)